MTIIEIARTQLGVQEIPKGQNKGKDIEKYLASVGIYQPAAWCMAFVYWVVQEYCNQYKRPNPLFRTGGVKNQWIMRRVLRVDKPQPGDIFIIINEDGTGHAGFVEYVKPDTIFTIEGNSNETGSREGYMVCRKPGGRTTKTITGFLRPIFIE